MDRDLSLTSFWSGGRSASAKKVCNRKTVKKSSSKITEENDNISQGQPPKNEKNVENSIPGSDSPTPLRQKYGKFSALKKIDTYLLKKW